MTYAPSAYALSISHRRLQDQRRHHSSLLAVIDPTQDLAFAYLEGTVVADFFDSAARKILVSREASRETVIQATPGYSYLHYSCHGFYDWQDVMRSGLVLAENQVLTLADIISSLDLSASRLVTLSASETGLAEFEQSSDEFISLSAGFLQIGAPGVISTLWGEGDLSTALLIMRFYHNHLNKNLPPAAALRQAQRWLRDLTLAEFERETAYLQMSDPHFYIKLESTRRVLLAQYEDNTSACPFAHPFYWAAFTFYGA